MHFNFINKKGRKSMNITLLRFVKVYNLFKKNLVPIF